MKEREHCELAVDRWSVEADPAREVEETWHFSRRSLVDLIERERADACAKLLAEIGGGQVPAALARLEAAARAKALADAADAIRDATWPTTVGGEYARRCAEIVEKLR